MSRTAPRPSQYLSETWQSFVVFAAIMTVGIALMFAIVLVI
jgi:hypothetical protein